MPAPEIKKLSSNSEVAQMKAALSSCVATEMKNGKPQDQAVAMCASMIREQSGKDMMPAPSGEGGKT